MTRAKRMAASGRAEAVMRSIAAAVVIQLLALPVAGQAVTPPPFRVEETTVSDIRSALESGVVSCRGLVDQYLKRIDAFDRVGPALNSLVLVNPRAREVADSLDAHRRAGGTVGSLHCIPVIVKDNFETIDLPTTAGSLALKGFTSTRDAFQVARLRAAGAIVLAKSNMAELAFSPNETVNSILPGYTRNPYALDRVTAGSSGGTAAAVAASFGAVGLGTDTGNSIRGPSSHQALVGIRSTMGLTSRGGVVPLFLMADIAGPMTRTVTDAAIVFQVIAGYDPNDPVTEAVRARSLPDYAASLAQDGLRGTRIGVLREAYVRPTADPEVLAVFQKALTDLRRAGATIVDSVRIADFDSLRARLRREGVCNPFKSDFETWLSEPHGPTPVKSLPALIESGNYHPSIQKGLEVAASDTATVACEARARFSERLRTMVAAEMDRHQLDALVYPTWSNPPRLIGDLNTAGGDNSQIFSPYTGWPAIQVPMGYTRGQLPAGITFFGRAWSEATLIRLAYAYEQATHHRRPPATVPPLP
jgi:amidase